METVKTVPNRLCSIEDLLKMLNLTEKEIEEIITKGYKRYKILKNGKIRWIEAPNNELKTIQKILLEYFQKTLVCPQYCMAGFKGQNNIKNAMRHRFKREVITTDISHCFPNTQAKFIQKFFAREFGATGRLLELLVRLTTYNGYLPTGAPTSSLLVCFAHKEVFDSIFKKMQTLDADMTIFIDDITISTHKHIGNWVIKYINNALKTHGLYIKKSKTKRYGYKYAVITGVHVTQSGKMSAPYNVGHSVIKALKEKTLSKMKQDELEGLIAKIGYIHQFGRKKMVVTKVRAIRQLKQLNKSKNDKE